MSDLSSPYFELPDGFRRLVLLVAYRGDAFSGAQWQDNAYTVQAAILKAIDHLKIVRRGTVNFSGRTDAGVHAQGQVIHIDVLPDSVARIKNLPMALNAVLDPAISVKAQAWCDDSEFHATVSAQWRWYRYRVFNHPLRCVWMRPDAAWVRRPLDVDAMQAAAGHFVGSHDFKSFKCPQTVRNNDVCQVIQAQWWRPDGDDLVFDIVANRFIYKMVRNLVGTMLEVGWHAGRSPDDIPAILAAQDRQAAGHTAQPGGLSLMAVHYPKPWDFFPDDVYVTRLNQVVQESTRHEQNLFRKAS